MSNQNAICSRPPGREEESAASEQWVKQQLDNCPVVIVDVNSLRAADSPRRSGENSEHTHTLAEWEEPLPPIVVHGPSMRVIDGMHRLQAAIVRGQDKIKANIYNGDERDAFVLAVKMNITHGLPLLRADRAAAAARIIGSHSHWSDRVIAAATGLGASTVAEIRKRSTARNGQLDRRVGRDGRTRPLNNAAGRQLVSNLLAGNPFASLRAIAREAGVSPSTVQDVRRRLRAGQNPVPERLQDGQSSVDDKVTPSRHVGGSGTVSSVELATTLEIMKKDPALRFSQHGRSILRWLDGHMAGMAEWEKIERAVPVHCAATVAKFFRAYATAWGEFATRLEEEGVEWQVDLESTPS